ncbi:MAG TPA: AMP-binding protein [Chitinophagales bacterium]|nr:AMP-binding protein [Chitinophagales bacterium]
MTSFKKYRSLIICGKKFSATELKELCFATLKRFKQAAWQRKFYHFISEWLDDSPCISAHTSGTTGTPKKVMIEKNKMLESAMLTLRHLNVQHNDKALLCLSCEHIAGKMMVVRAFAGGLNLIPIEPSSNPLKSISSSQIDFAAFVPLQVMNILNNAKSANQFRKIKNVLIGGASVSHELIRQLQPFPNNIYETYGMTETVSHVALRRLSDSSSGDKSANSKRRALNDYAYFKALKGVTFSRDARNCLIIHAPHLSKNLIVTNDIVELKDKHRFKWLGRFDNAVNSGGVKLIPEILEEKISSCINHDYFFAGKADKKLGEKLVLVIEGHALHHDALSRLKAEIAKYLGKYERPARIYFVRKFARTRHGKLNRRQTLSTLFSPQS